MTSSPWASVGRAAREPARWLVWLAAVAYTVALTLACLARHRAFASGGYDLGIFDQAVWLLGHGEAPFSTIRGRNLFADHFQPALVLLAPLGRVGSSPAGLLVLQAALLAAAAPVLTVLARARGAAPWLAFAVGLLWLASPLTQWANLFDYHPETAVPLLLALGALALERRRDWAFVATAVLASSLKEDASLVYLMWGLVVAWQGRRRFGLGLSAAAAAWFVLATKVVIPAFGGDLDLLRPVRRRPGPDPRRGLRLARRAPAPRGRRTPRSCSRSSSAAAGSRCWRRGCCCSRHPRSRRTSSRRTATSTSSSSTTSWSRLRSSRSRARTARAWRRHGRRARSGPGPAC